jgi:hypothetical protein
MYAYYTEKDQVRTYQASPYNTMEEIAGVAGGLKRHLELAEKESAGEHLALNLTTMCWYHLDDGDWSYIGQSVFEGE